MDQRRHGRRLQETITLRRGRAHQDIGQKKRAERLSHTDRHRASVRRRHRTTARHSTARRHSPSHRFPMCLSTNSLCFVRCHRSLPHGLELAVQNEPHTATHHLKRPKEESNSMSKGSMPPESGRGHRRAVTADANKPELTQLHRDRRSDIGDGRQGRVVLSRRSRSQPGTDSQNKSRS